MTTTADANRIRVISANVRIPVDEGDASWEARGPLLARTLADAQPDLIGTQELTSLQARDLLEAMPGMRMLGRDRRGGRDDEHCAILIRDDRLEVREHGDFWLSDTPDLVASITWGNAFPRITTWVRVRERATGRELVHANTHLPYRPEDADARERGARLILDRLEEIAAGDPIVLTGDFNCGPDCAVHEILSESLADVHDEGPHTGPDGTFHGFTGEPGERIDWVLQRGLRLRAARTMDEHEGTVWPSDHFPVLAELDWR
ncbi:endonuclease/exonuclease/phosphatase family protein [Homoserinibacter sp. YIM 151385]|uniref:endonuclease/exonuclease/phosphatase family protein n=1 Tax=Homoserinibacter sp. YIM 151385 TaxID=2985506 RepID=UPI0022EFE02D|nr:endonuclease/exonuclease/phosphatase family protein [Homoserinibacter sp. YIM 151385]WBU36984.1 endonuclease/exonuclease/phosphatase family protein [Homoserinibacter sp. YIM 151385]